MFSQDVVVGTRIFHALVMVDSCVAPGPGCCVGEGGEVKETDGPVAAIGVRGRGKAALQSGLPEVFYVISVEVFLLLLV